MGPSAIQTPCHLIGGTFDNNGGKFSSVVAKLASYLNSSQGVRLNGGRLDQLKELQFSSMSGVLLWMPNIDNSEDKILPRIKEENPKLLLVSSKRVVEKDYTEVDVIGRLLKSKSNLGLMITKEGELYRFKLLDPLGNLWADTIDISDLCANLLKRIETLKSMTRIGSVRVGGARPLDIRPDFIELVRKLGSKFSKFVNAVNPNRLLGNAATRCSYGFPSVRQDMFAVFVTRRNVDKATLSKDDFVEVDATSFDTVKYYGDFKPSVDTPIQLRLFREYPKVKYIIHGHVYVPGAVLTTHKLPCGSVEEVHEIVKLIPNKDRTNFVVNLKGHGCLLLMDDEGLKIASDIAFEGRPFPET